MRFDDEHYLSAPVMAFAIEMQKKLDENSYKGHSWRDLTPQQMLRRLKTEVAELERELKKRPKLLAHQREQHRRRVDREAADVGNFCAFIAEKFGEGGFDG